MSIPLDRLYHYIESVAQDVYGDTVIYRFTPHGSKNIADLHWLQHYDVFPSWTNPEIICHDQEPLNYNMYQYVPSSPGPKFKELFPDFDTGIFPRRNLRCRLGNIYDKCLILHSEQKSIEVEKYQNNGFIPVYYWSHAVIARDWFRYAKFYHPANSTNSDLRFLIYNRAWTGTREYRLKFADLLVDYNLVSSCQTALNELDPDSKLHYTDHQYQNINFKPQNQLKKYISSTSADSSASADFNINDYNQCNFEVVLETLFDDYRIHLTEKTLRPIACGLPFILATTPGGLQYLRNYGFKTFGNFFDESYDLIIDPISRLKRIIETMKYIQQQGTSLLTELQPIVDYNKKHFFSNEFQDCILQELQENLNKGLSEVEETNTSAEYIKIRKKYYALPTLKENRQYIKKTIGLDSTKQTLARAWHYYNKHLNK